MYPFADFRFLDTTDRAIPPLRKHVPGHVVLISKIATTAQVVLGCEPFQGDRLEWPVGIGSGAECLATALLRTVGQGCPPRHPPSLPVSIPRRLKLPGHLGLLRRLHIRGQALRYRTGNWNLHLAAIGQRLPWLGCLCSISCCGLGVVTFCWTSLSVWSLVSVPDGFRRRARAGCVCP